MPIDAANSELCQCGRDKERRHCPHCGYMNYYGVKENIKRAHPISGEIIENVYMFRCRSCNKHFDDLQWQYECKAKPSLRMQQIKRAEDSKETLLRKAESGAKFDENEKRHFRKIVGMNYDEYVMLWKQLAQQNVDKAIRKLENSKPKPIPVIKEKKLTPLQYHIENCNHCMMHDDLCDVGQNLKIAEGMTQP